MPSMEFLKDLVESGANFTQMSRERAENLVNELVREGQVRTEEYQRSVQDLLDRSRDNADKLNELIRGQVVRVLTELGIVSGKERGAAKARARNRATPSGASTATAKKATARKATVKKAPAKKATAKKASPAKRATAKKAPAKQATAKKASPAKRAPAKRATAKKAAS